MRTDGVQIAGEAISGVRRVIETDYGAKYVPHAPRRYETKAKNAQEAHEAIRPTDLTRRPRDAKRFLDADQARLYELIWLRTVASQMESAELERTTVDITATVAARLLELRATGTVVKFDGFLTLYQEGHDDDADDEEARRLPPMSVGEQPRQARDRRRPSISPSRRRATPKPRWSSAWKSSASAGRRPTRRSCRCSRTANTCGSTSGGFIPEDRGRIVVAFLESFFAKYVEYDFTAGLEEQLDLISNNEVAWREVLRDFWRDFIGAVDEIKDLRISQVLDALDELLAPHLFPPRADGGDPRQCPNCSDGRLIAQARQVSAPSSAARIIPNAAIPGRCRCPPTVPARSAPRNSAKIPRRGLEVTLRSGRFGPYVQLGEAGRRRKAETRQPAEGHDA